MALPFLPGLSIHGLACKTDFRRSQTFSKCDDVVFEADKCPAAPYTDIPRNVNTFAKSLPRWVAFDKQVLSFEAFFHENVTEQKEGSYRIRKVKIYFFLEDDTLMVVEPRVKNAGLNQGVLVKRHRAQRPPPCNHLYYVAEDFNMGCEIEIYGRVYKICNCDYFTSSFYKHLGIVLKPPLCLPEAPFEKELIREKDGRKLRGDNLDLHTSMQFFSRDPYVLRFYCYWDDRLSLYGDVRQLVLHYFLADHTMELIEVMPVNSGRDKTPWFLRRSKVPKQVEPMKRIGEVSKTSVLNVLGESGWSNRFIADPKEVGKVYDNCYLDCDIKIGSELNVYNRRVVVYDMDEFTKNYYRSKYGISDFTPGPCPPCADLKSSPCSKLPAVGDRPCEAAEQKVEGVGKGSCEPDVVACPPHCRRLNKLEQMVDKYKERWEHVPPYNGFGSEEDSLINCLSLHPENTTTFNNFVNFMVHDRRALDSNVLRFEVQLVSNFAPDADRKFVLYYYRTDDTFEIHENRINNSGFLGGVFCNRKRIPKPCQERFKCDFSQYYGPHDLYIDSMIVYSGHPFKLTGADEYALTYMECHKDEFPQSDAQLVLRKLTPLVEDKRMKATLEFCRANECMPYEDFKCLVANSMKEVTESSCISEHDFLTLARYYSRKKTYEENVECDLNVLRTELKKQNFGDFEEMCYTCKHFDSSNSGKLHVNDMLTIVKAYKIPVFIERFTAVFKLLADENCNIDYCDLLARINWKWNISVSSYYSTPAEERKEKQMERNVLTINFKCLFEDLVKIIYP